MCNDWLSGVRLGSLVFALLCLTLPLMAFSE